MDEGLTDAEEESLFEVYSEVDSPMGTERPFAEEGCLPEELLFKIFSFLDPKDLIENVGLVSQEWLRVSKDKYLYRELKLIDFPRDRILFLLSRASKLTTISIYESSDFTLRDVYYFDDYDIIESISEACPMIKSLTINARIRVRDTSLEKLMRKCSHLIEFKLETCVLLDWFNLSLASWKNLETFKVVNCKGFTGDTLLKMAHNCEKLQSFHLDMIMEDESLIEFINNFGKNLLHLTLNCSNLTYYSFSILSKCSNLNHLKLISCSLLNEYLFDEWLFFSKLEFLGLYDATRVSKTKLQVLFSKETFKDLKRLELDGISDLDNNTFKLICTKCRRLVHLRVSSAKITCLSTIPMPFNLAHLDLNSNPLSDFAIGSLSNSCPFLRTLNISDCQIENIVFEQQFQRLEYLDISNNNLHGDLIDNILKWCPGLINLKMNNCELESLTLTKTFKQLKYLWISENQFGDDGLKQICEMCPELVKLDVNKCEIYSLSMSLRLKRLTYLDISNNCIGGATMSVMCENFPRLLQLIMCNCGLNDVFITRDFKKLTHLDISYNAIYDPCLDIVGKMCPNLELLNITECQKITDGGLIFIIENLKKLKKLLMGNLRRVNGYFLEEIENSPSLKYVEVGMVTDENYINQINEIMSNAKIFVSSF